MRKISNSQHSISKKKIKKEYWMKIFFLLILVGLAYVLIKNLYSSAFFQKYDRINVVFDTENVEFFSLGLHNDIHYYLSLYPDLKLLVPGGYGYYRAGALRKIVDLEKKPAIYKKVYSYVLSGFVDYYFYPNPERGAADGTSEKIKIYFGDRKGNFSMQGFNLIFFGRSNAHFFDRLFVFMQFLGKTRGQFKLIDLANFRVKKDRTIFSSEEFMKSTQGNFYKKAYRNEERHVQIMYSKSYNTAKAVSQIIEGEGIRVADLSETEENQNTCEITEDADHFSVSARALANFFACKLVRGDTGAYDIVMILGGAEEEWEIEL